MNIDIFRKLEPLYDKVKSDLLSGDSISTVEQKYQVPADRMLRLLNHLVHAEVLSRDEKTGALSLVKRD